MPLFPEHPFHDIELVSHIEEAVLERPGHVQHDQEQQAEREDFVDLFHQLVEPLIFPGQHGQFEQTVEADRNALGVDRPEPRLPA